MLNLQELDKRVESTIPPDKRAQLQQIIDGLKPAVAEIEAGPEMTQGHYGSYMAIMGRIKSPAVAAYVLLKAGANSFGVSWAYKIATGC